MVGERKAETQKRRDAELLTEQIKDRKTEDTVMMTKNKSTSTLLVLLALMPGLAFSDSKNDSHMEWWRDARFGMFIHWGLYSVQGG